MRINQLEVLQSIYKGTAFSVHSFAFGSQISLTISGEIFTNLFITCCFFEFNSSFINQESYENTTVSEPNPTWNSFITLSLDRVDNSTVISGLIIL